MSDDFDYDQDSEEVLQREPHALAVPVRVVEQPNASRPNIGGSDWSQEVTFDRVEPLVDGDPRRSSVTIFAIDQAMYVGRDQNTVQGGTSALLPEGASVTISHREPLFARCAVENEVAVVSVYVERWSD